MADNDFLPFATDMSAEVLTQLQWQNDADRPVGWSTGPADNLAINKAIRQACFIAAAIGQVIANSGTDALDNGDLDAFVAILESLISTGGGIRTVTANTTVVVGDGIILANADAALGGQIEITYPPALITGKTVLIGKIGTTSNPVLLYDGVTVQGAITSPQVGGQIAAYQAFSDGANLWLA